MKAAINFQTPYTAQSLVEYLRGSTLETCVCWKLTPKQPVRGPKNVTWTGALGVAVAGNTVNCALTGANDWGSHGASSVQNFTDEGEMRFRRGAATARFRAGLIEQTTPANFASSPHFAWEIDTVSAQAVVMESGSGRISFALPPETAVFAVKRLWDYNLNRYKIVYAIDDEVKYTSTLTPLDSLRADVTFSGIVAGAITDVQLTQTISALGATSHTRDLELPGHAGVVFRSSLGGAPTVIDTETGHESAGLQVESVFDDAAVTQESVDAGDWAGAKFEIFTVKPLTLPMGQLVEFSGRVGKIETEGEGFRAEARALTAVAQANIGRRATAKCDVRNFADALLENRCKLSRAATAADGYPNTVTGTVTSGESSTQFVDSARTEPDAHFTMGEVTFTSGPLAGRTLEVREYDATAKRFTFRRAAPVRIGTNWTYTAVRGCRRTDSDCITKFANIINYRGERFITNIETVNKIKRAS